MSKSAKKSDKGVRGSAKGAKETKEAKAERERLEKEEEERRLQEKGNHPPPLFDSRLTETPRDQWFSNGGMRTPRGTVEFQFGKLDNRKSRKWKNVVSLRKNIFQWDSTLHALTLPWCSSFVGKNCSAVA